MFWYNDIMNGGKTDLRLKEILTCLKENTLENLSFFREGLFKPSEIFAFFSTILLISATVGNFIILNYANIIHVPKLVLLKDSLSQGILLIITLKILKYFLLIFLLFLLLSLISSFYMLTIKEEKQPTQKDESPTIPKKILARLKNKSILILFLLILINSSILAYASYSDKLNSNLITALNLMITTLEFLLIFRLLFPEEEMPYGKLIFSFLSSYIFFFLLASMFLFKTITHFLSPNTKIPDNLFHLLTGLFISTVEIFAILLSAYFVRALYRFVYELVSTPLLLILLFLSFSYLFLALPKITISIIKSIGAGEICISYETKDEVNLPKSKVIAYWIGGDFVIDKNSRNCTIGKYPEITIIKGTEIINFTIENIQHPSKSSPSQNPALNH